jgi:hypothetical protein
MAGSERRRKPFRVWFLLGMLALASNSYAHGHWIDLDRFNPAVGEVVSLFVRSGHYFPKSGQKLSEKVIQRVTAKAPDGQTLAVEIAAGKKEWLGTVTPKEGGTYLIAFSLKRPRAPAPNYEGKAILIAGSGSDSPDRYVLGSGLELIPEKPISELKPGDELPVWLALDGVKAEGEVEIVPENGKSTTARTSPEQPASVKLRTAGRYLLTASVKGRGCSLVFHVSEAEEESK